MPPRTDENLLLRFENQLDPGRLVSGNAPVSTIGFGQLSVVFEIEGMPGVAFKRLPPFPNADQCRYHARSVNAYRSLLNDQLHLPVVEQECYPLENARGEHILYIAQARIPAEHLAPRVLVESGVEATQVILSALLRETARVWHRNAIDAPDVMTGLDARLSNWALFLSSSGEVRPLYLDTSTPFFRRIGQELPNEQVFLKRVPSALLGFVRDGFREVLSGYYDLRQVLIDLAAGFLAEGLPDRLPIAVESINGFLETDGQDFRLRPVRLDEVERHYRNDRRFWTLFRNLSQLDRSMKRSIGRRYPHLLPA